MRIIALAGLLALSVHCAFAAPNPVADWTGVWQITTPGKPGGVINVANDGGPNGNSLSGVIVFYVMNRETGERIAIEPRTMVNLHLEANALVFEVRRILKPHLKGDPPPAGDVLDPSDIVEMTLVPNGEGKATLTCLKCGDASPADLTKE